MPEPRGGQAVCCVLRSREPRTGPGAQWFPSWQPRSLSLFVPSYRLPNPEPSSISPPFISIACTWSPFPGTIADSRVPSPLGRLPSCPTLLAKRQVCSNPGRHPSLPGHCAHSLASNTRSLSTGPLPPSAASPVGPAHLPAPSLCGLCFLPCLCSYCFFHPTCHAHP